MNRWPATRRVICGVIVTAAAGPGCIAISTRSMTGRVPGTLAMAVTPSVPVDPAETRPELSTLPSKRPPEPTKRIMALATGLPELSTACALKRSVSPAVIVRVSGEIVTWAMGDGAEGLGGVCGCCCRARTRLSAIMFRSGSGWTASGSARKVPYRVALVNAAGSKVENRDPARHPAGDVGHAGKGCRIGQRL